MVNKSSQEIEDVDIFNDSGDRFSKFKVLNKGQSYSKNWNYANGIMVDFKEGDKRRLYSMPHLPSGPRFNMKLRMEFTDEGITSWREEKIYGQ